MKDTTPDWKSTAREFNKRNGWSCDEALNLAIEVLTDANWHALAAKLQEAANDLMILEWKAQQRIEASDDPMDDYNYVGSKDHY